MTYRYIRIWYNDLCRCLKIPTRDFDIEYIRNRRLCIYDNAAWTVSWLSNWSGIHGFHMYNNRMRYICVGVE
jgi:hypothetical protein